jgi:hypothetical protein
MARIPIGNFGNAIADPAPRVNIPSGAFDNGGAGLQKLGEVGVSYATQALQEIRAHETEVQAKNADTELTRRLMELQHDPDKGYMGKVGSNAISSYADTTKSAKAIRDEISAGIKDPKAKSAFDLVSGSRLNSAIDSISRHAQTQNRVVQLSASQSRAQQSIDSAAMSYDNDAAFNEAITIARNEAAAQSRAMGLDANDAALRAKVYENSAWEKRFATARMKDPLYALDLFQKNEGALDPARRDNMGAALFAAAAPVMANDIAMRGLVTNAKNPQEAEAMAMAANEAGITNVRVTTGETYGKSTDTIFDRLPSDMKMRVIGMAKQQLSQTRSLLVHQANGLLRDAEVAANDGKRTMIDPSMFAAFGPQAQEVQKRYQQSQAMADVITQVQAMPVRERAAAVDAALPQQTGAGYADSVARANTIADAVRRVNQAQTDDPVMFTIQSSPNTVKPAFELLQETINNPVIPAAQRRDAAQRFAAATIAEQERLGNTPAQAGRVSRALPVLPKQMATAIANQFVTQPEGGQGPAVMLQMQADMWGKYWPQVYSQIAKDIGPTARVVANLGDSPAASVLSMHANMPIAELKKGVSSEDSKVINETLAAELDGARRSLWGWTTGGAESYNDYEQAAEKLALIYRGQNIKPIDAAKRAARDVFNDRYEVHGNARIPKSKDIDARQAIRGMNRALAESGNIPVRVPAHEAAILGAEYTAKQLAASLKANGFFVTLGDDSGVQLWMRGRSGEQSVEHGNGGPITYTWKQLQDIAKKPDAPAAVMPFEESRGGAATGMRVTPKPAPAPSSTPPAAPVSPRADAPQGSRAKQLEFNLSEIDAELNNRNLTSEARRILTQERAKVVAEMRGGR